MKENNCTNETNPTYSRRNFLSGLGLAAGGTALGGTSAAAAEKKTKEGKPLSVPDMIASNYSETLKEMSRQHQTGEDKLLWKAPYWL